MKTDQSQFLAQWEEDELSAEVIFDERFQIDNDPFHLGEKNGLLKVHSLFSLMGLNHAYVTSMGRSEDLDAEIQCIVASKYLTVAGNRLNMFCHCELNWQPQPHYHINTVLKGKLDLPTDRLTGVVGLRELRKSIEDAKDGQLVAEQKREDLAATAPIAPNEDVVVTLSGDDCSTTSEDETCALMN